MKSMHFIASTIVAAALISGCSREEPEPTPLTAPESTRQIEQNQNQNIDGTRGQTNETAPYTNPQNQGTGDMGGNGTAPNETDTEMNGSESMYDNNTPTNNTTTPGTTTN